jgi:hypothetical protein
LAIKNYFRTFFSRSLYYKPRRKFGNTSNYIPSWKLGILDHAVYFYEIFKILLNIWATFFKEDFDTFEFAEKVVKIVTNQDKGKREDKDDDE